MARTTRKTVPTARELVEQRAHELFTARGGEHGADLDDWLEAERQLQAKATTPTRPVRKRATPTG